MKIEYQTEYDTYADLMQNIIKFSLKTLMQGKKKTIKRVHKETGKS